MQIKKCSNAQAPKASGTRKEFDLFEFSDENLDEAGRDKAISEREEDILSAASSDSCRINESASAASASASANAASKSGKTNPETSSTGGEDEDVEDDEDEDPSDLGEMIAIRKFVRDVSSAATR